jgi:hypothetical protein
VLIPATPILICAILPGRHLSTTICEKYPRLYQKMPSEPEWLASISSGTVCTWFYIMAILNSLVAVAGVVVIVMLLSKGVKSMGTIVPLLVSMSIGLTNAWFLFMMCNRSINKEGFGWGTNLAKNVVTVATGGRFGF